MGKFITAVIAIVLIISYFANIVKLFSTDVIGMAIGRTLGIFFFPLGMILGFF